MRILIAGGGSGGHVIPGIAVAEALRRSNPDVELAWLGTSGSIEERLVPPTGLMLLTVRAGKLNRFLGRRTFIDLAQVPVGLVEAIARMRRFQPSVVFTCGGFVAAPAGIAAWLTGHPVVALQQDVSPNLANRLISPFAKRIVLAFPVALPRFRGGQAVVLGNPLPAARLQGNPALGRELFHLPRQLPMILITGGSQGALGLNRLVLPRLGDWLRHAVVVHLCGEPSVEWVAQAAATLPTDLRARYVWRPFVIQEMPHLLAAADLVVSRAGAATLAEIAALAKPAILVPLPPSLGHSPQVENARFFARAGAAVALNQDTASPDLLRDEVLALLASPGRRQALGDAARSLGHHDATKRVAALLIDLARQRDQYGR